jgi:hypothetical protein
MCQSTKSLRSSLLRGARAERPVASRERPAIAVGEPHPENRGVVDLTQNRAPVGETNTVSPLRQHMIEDMAAHKVNPRAT